MLNVSALTTYLFCQRKLFLQSVLGFKEPIKGPALLGTIRHEAHDALVKAEESIVSSITEKMPFDDVKALYKKHYREVLHGVVHKHKEKLLSLELNPGKVFKDMWFLIEIESESRARNVFDFMDMHLVYGKELWQRLTPKIRSSIYLTSAALNLQGFLDQVEVYDEGYVPVELKTGKSLFQQAWDNHKVQLAAYAMLLEHQFGKEVKEGYIYYLDEARKVHIPINIFLKEEIKELMRKVNQLLRDRELPDFVDNKNKCTNCGLKDVCYNEKTVNKRFNEVIKNRNVYI